RYGVQIMPVGYRLRLGSIDGLTLSNRNERRTGWPGSAALRGLHSAAHHARSKTQRRRCKRGRLRAQERQRQAISGLTVGFRYSHSEKFLRNARGYREPLANTAGHARLGRAVRSRIRSAVAAGRQRSVPRAAYWDQRAREVGHLIGENWTIQDF